MQAERALEERKIKEPDNVRGSTEEEVQPENAYDIAADIERRLKLMPPDEAYEAAGVIMRELSKINFDKVAYKLPVDAEEKTRKFSEDVQNINLEIRDIIKTSVDKIPQDKIDLILKLHEDPTGIKYVIKTLLIKEILNEISFRPVEALNDSEKELRASLKIYIDIVKMNIYRYMWQKKSSDNDLTNLDFERALRAAI